MKRRLTAAVAVLVMSSVGHAQFSWDGQSAGPADFNEDGILEMYEVQMYFWNLSNPLIPEGMTVDQVNYETAFEIAFDSFLNTPVELTPEELDEAQWELIYYWWAVSLVNNQSAAGDPLDGGVDANLIYIMMQAATGGA